MLRLVKRCALAGVAGVYLLAVGCSSGDDATSTDPMDAVEAATADRTFCDQAQAIQTFQNEVAVDLADPTKAQAFIEVAIDQLEVLGEKAPDDIAPEIEQVAGGYRALDVALAANGYDLNTLLVTNYTDPDASEAADALDSYLGVECGLRAGSPDVQAPQPFTPAELDVILAPTRGDDAVDPVIDADTVTGQLVEIGLTPVQAQCLVDSLGDETMTILLGGPLEGDARTEFEAILEECSINPEELG